MNKYELFVPDETRAMIDSFISTARVNLERDGYLVPVAFVGKFDGDFVMVPSPMNLPKDWFARIVRDTAKKRDADYVLHIDEAWTYSAKTGAEAEAARAKYGQVKDIPGRIDAVMFKLETHVGLFMAGPVREDKPSAPGKYTFGAVEFDLMPRGEGRFVGLLPPRGKVQ